MSAVRFFSKTLFFRGHDTEDPIGRGRVLWLSTSAQYARQWGNKLSKFTINDNLILCPTDKELVSYVGIDPKKDQESYYDRLFHPTNNMINKLKSDGYNSYYFEDDEYHCLILALFDKSIIKPVKR